MTAKKSKPKAAPAKLSPEKGTGMDARGHKHGSRKSKVHEVWEREDESVAFALGQKLKLKPETLRSWFGVWRRASTPSKKAKAPEKKPVTKPTDKPAEPTQAAAAH